MPNEQAGQPIVLLSTDRSMEASKAVLNQRVRIGYNQAMNYSAGSPGNDDPSRRDFIAGRLQQPTADTVEGADTELASVDYLFQATRRAMACDFQVSFDSRLYPEGPEAALAALDVVDQLEAELSVFRDSSQVSQLNRLAAEQPVTVDTMLCELLQHCLEIWKQTDGAFDITSTPLSRAWGFFRREGRMPSTREVEDARKAVGSQWLKVEHSNRTVRFEHPDLEINLGSIGKGFALDRCGACLAVDVGDFIIHGGYSSILAHGNRQLASEARNGWQIAVRHPLKPQQRLIELTLNDCAAGTSGSANQFFSHQGKRYSHLLDPRTGWPAEEMLSATVLSSSAADADALATAFFVMGVQRTVQFIKDNPQVRAVLVCSGERSGATDVHLVGLSDDSWKLLSDTVTLIDHDSELAGK